MRNFFTAVFFAELDQTFRHINGVLPVAGGLMNNQQLFQRKQLEILLFHQLVEHVFRTIIETGSHVITTQLLYGEQALFESQRSTFHQRLVDTDRTIDFTTGAEQVAQSQVRFDCTAVLFQHFEEQIDRFILLIGKQEVNPRDVFTRQAVSIFLFVLLRTSAPHVPAIGGRNGQQQKQQF
ncbi:hypothetical protein SRABI106_03472 [Rahnella aquatilis]|nr:hypothetical protein SRABI106_03472 [Rahnella aquatilis]